MSLILIRVPNNSTNSTERNTNAVLTTTRLKQAVISFRSLSDMRQNATWVQTQTQQVLEAGLLFV